jgi:hypothetical protein
MNLFLHFIFVVAWTSSVAKKGPLLVVYEEAVGV